MAHHRIVHEAHQIIHMGAEIFGAGEALLRLQKLPFRLSPCLFEIAFEFGHEPRPQRPRIADRLGTECLQDVFGILERHGTTIVGYGFWLITPCLPAQAFWPEPFPVRRAPRATGLIR